MSRPLRLLLAALLLVVATVTLLAGLSETTLIYSLPTPGGVATTHQAVFTPAVGASVLAGIVTLVTAGWLGLNAVRQPATTWWLVVCALLALDLGVLLAVSGLERPTF